MEDRTRWLLFELVTTVLAATASVALLVSLHSHLWLATAADTPAGELPLLYTDSVEAEMSTTESVRLYGAITAVTCLGALAAVVPACREYIDNLRQETRRGVAGGVGVAVAGGGLYLLAPDLMLAALGLTLLAYGLLAAVACSAYLAVVPAA